MPSQIQERLTVLNEGLPYRGMVVGTTTYHRSPFQGNRVSRSVIVVSLLSNMVRI